VPEKPLVDAFPLIVALDHRFDFFLNDYHVVVHDGTAHEVIRQVTVPLLPYLKVKAGVQEVVYQVCHPVEAHPNQIGRELSLKA